MMSKTVNVSLSKKELEDLVAVLEFSIDDLLYERGKHPQMWTNWDEQFLSSVNDLYQRFKEFLKDEQFK
ncbi:hypothetical protein [Thermoflavimicrobium dichotomicum]|uniref:Uncharacterized protein n=1 Tax=Thermoflavimicrobium dichotomicum TaxID=46223 RepID=A0A1I3ULH0_9BACL|nr:hypothetical protein [Thermoflavimicrobium dichotomicum]SFJ82587.1 hypothetical protein SAMN05421852_12512 [Thermoflavimicrobium dichotomicum]